MTNQTGSVRQAPAQRGRHIEGVADGEPDVTGRNSRGQGLISRPIAEHSEHVVLGDGARAKPEMLHHEGTEFGQLHVDRRYRAHARPRRGQAGTVDITDPSSPLAVALMAVMLLVVLALLIKQWRGTNRK